jgi:TonB-linked SusC/RagA family outer membrane protein
VEQTLQGKAAGVFIEQNNGKVGSAVRVRVRGSTSITASNDPLYVVDGVPINTTAINDGLYVYLNPLNDINFNDIESVSILKDASASAIYGSRGANGVILITTKRGKKGAAKIDFDYQQGWSEPTRTRDFLDANQFVDYFTQAAINAGKYRWAQGIGNFDSEQDAIDKAVANLNDDFAQISGGTELGTVNTDWQAQAFQKATSLTTNLAISGGTDNIRYYISAGYSKQDGIMLGNSGDRGNILANLDATLSKKLTAGISLNIIRDVNHDIPDDNEFSTPLQIVALSPITPLYDSTGNYTNEPVTIYPNPLIDATQSEFNTVTFRNIANAYAEYSFIPQLSLRGEAGADLTNLNTDRFWGSNTQTGLGIGGYALNYASSAENYDTKLLLNYHQSFASKHNVEAVAGMEYQRYNDVYSEVDGTGFPNDDLKTVYSAANIVYGTGAKNYYRFLSYLARVNYDYMSKYLFAVTGRYDGSSRFGQNNRYGFFPSVSAGWVLSQENFWKNISAISFLKLRASYGIIGNAEIPNFSYAGLYGVSSYGGNSALYPSTLPNPDLTWERTAQTDFGIDFGILKDRINGELDYYLKKTDGLLLDVPVPSTTGFTSQTQNVGKTQNSGFEFLINADILVNTFTWSASVNFAANKNKVVELAPGQTIIDLGGTEALNVAMVGQSIGIFYGAEYAGADPANGDALWYINDPENPSNATTNDFNAANFVVIGDPNPDFIGGFSNTFGYKGFSLDFTFQGVYGNDVNLNGDHWMNGNAATYDNQIVEALNYWKEPGDITNVPEPRLGFDNGNQFRSSRYISNASYLRMKTITFAYSLPKSWVKKMKMENFQLYASSYNLFTITNYGGWDPEVSTDLYADNINVGVDFYSAPQPKTIVFGVKLTL